jgi:molybdenum-dependent DNA-binding transcriptional regulator ModE
MRPPKIKRSGIEFPLDFILGTPAMVRLLRVVTFDSGGSIGVTEAAKLAGLTPKSARKALTDLEKMSVVTRVGTGRAQIFSLKDGNPYISLLRELFMEEHSRHEELFREMREALRMPEIQTAWVLDISTEHSLALEISIVAETQAISWIGPEIRTRLVNTEKKFDVIIEVNVFTRADDQEVPSESIVLWGACRKNGSKRSPGAQTHAESAERSLKMARAISGLIKVEPSLVRRAINHTNRLLREDQGTANSDINEWRQLLETYSTERLRDFMITKSSRAERLRRSSPFFAVLTSDERDRMLQKLEEMS